MTPIDRLLNARLLGNLVEFLHETAIRAPAAHRTAARLGIVNFPALAHFRLGFGGTAFSRIIPSKGGIRGILTEIGILGPNGREALRGALIVPLRNSTNNVVGLAAISPDGRETCYPTGTPILRVNLPALHAPATIFTDSVLRALLLIQSGISSAVPCGKNVGSKECAILKSHRPSKAYLTGDNPALLQQLQGAGVPCFKISVDYPTDPAKVAQSIDNAVPFDRYGGGGGTESVARDGFLYGSGPDSSRYLSKWCC